MKNSNPHLDHIASAFKIFNDAIDDEMKNLERADQDYEMREHEQAIKENTMYTSKKKKKLLSRMKIEHKETLHKAETRKPEKVKAVLDVLKKKDYVGELTLSEIIDIIELVKAPTNDYNYIWEMFNDN